jgi:hypothetical protein
MARSALTSKKTMTSSFMSFVKSGKLAVPDKEKEVPALDRLKEVEACVTGIECGSDKVFRTFTPRSPCNSVASQQSRPRPTALAIVVNSTK